MDLSAEELDALDNQQLKRLWNDFTGRAAISEHYADCVKLTACARMHARADDRCNESKCKQSRQRLLDEDLGAVGRAAISRWSLAWCLLGVE